jgi:hypothetical protein
MARQCAGSAHAVRTQNLATRCVPRIGV